MNKQYNYITKSEYQGQNQVDLMSAKHKFDYKSDAWLTFLQARNSGLKIKKGSKSIAVFRGFQEFSELDKVDNKIKTHTAPLGFAHVFNLDQTEVLTAKKEN